MAVVRKVQSKLIKKEEPKEKEVKQVATSPAAEAKADEAPKKAVSKVKKCAFCANKTEPKYWDSAALRRFVSDRGRIYSRSRYGTCSKHQRRVTREVKRARHLALLPFTVRI